MIIYHQQVIFSHKSVPYSQEKIIQPHLFNIYTLKHDLQIAQEFRMPGLGSGGGDQPNLGNACILGTCGPATPLLTLPIQKKTNRVKGI